MQPDQHQSARSTTSRREVEPLVEYPDRPGCIAGRSVCSRPVVAILTAGCVHEHIRRGRVCAHHLDKKLTCRGCETNAARPHRLCYVHQLDVEAVA